MGAMQMANKMQIRRDSAANWTSADPTLSQGEIGLDLTTGNIKIGDGETSWMDLDYAIPSIEGLATETYVDNSIEALKGGADTALDTLMELAQALGDDANFSATVATQLGLKANTADLATVATSGSYNDLSDKPSLSVVATTGNYNSLLNKPTLFDGQYTSLSGRPVLFSGSYLDLTDKPTLFDFNYNSLTNKPTLFNGNYNSLTNKPNLANVATTGSYADLSGNPSVSKITLQDGDSSNPAIVFDTDGSRDTGIFHPADGVVCVTSNGTEKLRIDGGGARINGFVKVAQVNGSLPNPPEAGMIVLDGTTFKGYNGSAWVNLN